LALAASLALVLLAHPSAGASDVWGNVGPASPFGIGGLDGRYPLGNYALDEHFTAVSAGVFSGVDVSGVPPMIAYFLAEVLWQLTAFLANCLISLFGFAFSLDLVNGSSATGDAGALGPVAAAIHSIYSSVFGGPWLVLGVAVAGCWAMWKALVQRRYAETAGSLALSLIYITIALFFVAEPAQTIGAASKWTNEMSGAFLSIARSGSPGSQRQAKQAGANQLFGLMVFQPWSVLEFGGTEHCVKPGTGSSGSDPVSVPVAPLAPEASRRLQAGEEVSSEGKLCIDNARKYSSHFLRFGPGSEERNQEYEALNDGDASKLPEADPSKAAGTYKLGVADKPATDAMEEGGQYQRLLIAVVVFLAELGAFCLLGALSVGVILSQVLLLLLLAFSPVALVAAVIPGRGHEFFKGWLAKLAGFLLRKAAYSLILAVLLAVCAAISAATSELGWLMSFGLQCLFFWAVFVQRKSLTESLVGIATGPRVPGGEGALKVLALYYGARTAGRPLRSAGRSVGSAVQRTRRWHGGGERRADSPRSFSGAPREEEQRPYSAGGGAQVGEAPRPANHPPSVEGAGEAAPSPGRSGKREDEQASGPRKRDTAKGSPRKKARSKGEAASPKGDAAPKRPAEVTGSPRAVDVPSAPAGGAGESPLSAQLRAEREHAQAGAEGRGAGGKPSSPPDKKGDSQASDSRAPRRVRKGPRVGKRGGRE
jgi:hypothetical protein